MTTRGYSNGDKCPKCKGLVTIRYKGDGKTKYAQCAKCYWNTFDD